MDASNKSFNKFEDMLAEAGVILKNGDRVRLYDLSCIRLSTTTLLRAMSKMLNRGIAIEIISSGIVIEPTADDKVRGMIDALDAHYRYLHGIKIHHPDRKGRRRLLAEEQLPKIQEELSKPGATATAVAQKFGVARSTLFNYLERFDLARHSGPLKKSGEPEPSAASEEASEPAHGSRRGH